MMQRHAIDAVLDQLVDLVVRHYVFADLAPEVGRAVRAARAAGRYPAGIRPHALAALVTEDLQSVNGDQHLRLLFSVDELPADTGDAEIDAVAELAEYERLAARSAGGVTRVELLEPNLGYLKLDRLFPPVLAGPAVAAAMTLVAGSDALIIDLRHRGGGSPWMVPFICTYLLPAEPRYLYGVALRESDTVQQYWTSASVPGPRYGTQRPVAVLTSRSTFSAGEALASCLREQGRATLIGETTGGGANPCNFYRVHPQLRATIPVGRTVSVVTGGNWEGVGVAPDIEVPAGQALDRARTHLLTDPRRAAIRRRGGR